VLHATPRILSEADRQLARSFKFARYARRFDWLAVHYDWPAVDGGQSRRLSILYYAIRDRLLNSANGLFNGRINVVCVLSKFVVNNTAVNICVSDIVGLFTFDSHWFYVFRTRVLNNIAILEKTTC
jgi:hypothetical protein